MTTEKKKEKRSKVVKGISLDPSIVDAVKRESANQRRSFSSQVALILEQWLKDKSNKQSKEE
jgi:hypothetical protein